MDGNTAHAIATCWVEKWSTPIALQEDSDAPDLDSDVPHEHPTITTEAGRSVGCPAMIPIQGDSMSAHLPLSSVGSTNYERVMGHAPHVLEPWSLLEAVFFERSILPGELLEQVRRTLTLGHGCAYCRAKAGPPDAQHEAARTSLAVALAQAFVADHAAIERSQIEVLRGEFTDAELVELVAFISFMWAGGTFGKVLGIQPPATVAVSGGAPA